MVEIVLKYKVSLTETIYDFAYTHIQVTANGRGFTIAELTDKEARELIRDHNLILEPKESVDYHLGRVYHDGNFKRFLNARPSLKQKLYKIIDTLDDE